MQLGIDFPSLLLLPRRLRSQKQCKRYIDFNGNHTLEDLKKGHGNKHIKYDVKKRLYTKLWSMESKQANRKVFIGRPIRKEVFGGLVQHYSLLISTLSGNYITYV